MKLKCENCFCEFEKKQEQKTCSRKCSDELKKKNNREKRICIYCKKEFSIKKTLKNKLCSCECRKKWGMLKKNKDLRIKKSHDAIKKNNNGRLFINSSEFKKKSSLTKKEKYGDENYNNMKKNRLTKLKNHGDENYNNMDKNKFTKLKKYGDENYNNRDKAKETTKKLYGVEYAIQKEEFKEKQKETNLKKYNISSFLEIKEVRDLGKKVMKEKYGVEYAMQNKELFQKCLKAQYKILQYKNTELYYQGTYELYFLEEMEKIGKLNEIQNGKSYNYVFDGEEHVYHSDFFYNGENIEIKSGWTYNNNGKNKKLEEINKTKWKSVTDSGDKIRVLLSKQQIELFVSGII